MGYLGYKPADKPLTAADITDGIITSAKITDATIVNGDIANSTIALAKLSATGIPSASNFLRGDNSWVAAGGANTPAFEATRSTSQTISHNTSTKIQFNNEIFDTNSAYDPTTNYRFTVPSGQGGKYFIYSFVGLEGTNTREYAISLSIFKNGSAVFGTFNGVNANSNLNMLISIARTLELNATDYIEIFSNNFDYTSNGSLNIVAGRSLFGAYKLIE